MRYSIYFILLLLTGCSVGINDKDVLSDLRGKWDQVSRNGVYKFAGEEHTFTFKDTSFTLSLHEYSDAQYENDTCRISNGYFHIKGNFLIGPEKIILKGIYTDESFKNVDSLRIKCGMSEKYSRTLNYELFTDSLYLYDTYPDVDHEIILIKVKRKNYLLSFYYFGFHTLARSFTPPISLISLNCRISDPWA